MNFVWNGELRDIFGVCCGGADPFFVLCESFSLRGVFGAHCASC